ncbi:NUDIX hydrolase [Plantibacter sp. Mn2098]|uniref:NUDIX hydrolase n=1 Tax=Plantibacter sp. Mn2098 TaxID=3395266 RepID=UPI003BBB4DB8
MPDGNETLVHVTHDAPWLPPGSHADVVRSDTPPHPMCVVRLLLRDADRVFCVPRTDGRLDLPMKPTAVTDHDGRAAIHSLVESVVGKDATVRFIGAVRNVVDAPEADYAWPTPLAHFGVWVSGGTPRIDGTWVDIQDELSPVRDRHWYPLSV